MYNGFYGDTRINNVFAFAPTGKIIYAFINYPGSSHDSQVSMDLCIKVIEKIGNYAICVDQGFKRSGSMYDKFLGPISTEMRRKLSLILLSLLIRLHEMYVSLRQASEWGMRAL